MNLTAKLTVLGARGSVPVSGKEYIRYGGATTCFRLDCVDCTVFLDAGTGILQSSDKELRNPCHILLTHPHADHLFGLPLFRLMFSPENSVLVWGASFDGMEVKEQLDCLMRPPIWPVTSEVFKAKMKFCSFMAGDELQLSPKVKAQTLKVSHPGGCVAYKIMTGGRSLVLATDVELAGETPEKLAAFAKDCDLFILDAQYTNEEYKNRVGFGHPSIDQSLELVKMSKPRKTLLTHHDPYRTDEELDKIEKTLPKNVHLAAEGLEMSL